MGRQGRNGHYCWVCSRTRPNERFSGKGHARHVCRECARLGSAELALRQLERNIDRLVSWEGTIPRQHRPAFDRYLVHENERIRAHAAGLLARHDSEVARLRDERAADLAAEAAFADRCMGEIGDSGADGRATDTDDDIPF